MQRIIVIVLLIVLGAFCYFAFEVVNSNTVSDLKNQNAQLQQQVSAEKQAHTDDLSAQKADKQRVRDALVIMFPAQKEGIDGVFNPSPSTKPTTAPAK